MKENGGRDNNIQEFFFFFQAGAGYNIGKEKERDKKVSSRGGNNTEAIG